MIINDSLISWHQYSQLLQQLLKYLRRRLSMNARDTKLYPLNMKCSGLFLWILFNLHSKSSKSPFDRKTNCLCSLLQQLSVGLAGVTQGRTLLGDWNDVKKIYKNILTFYIWLNYWIIDIISVIIQNLRWSQIWVAPSLVILYTDLSPPFYWCPSLPHIRELVSAIHWYF